MRGFTSNEVDDCVGWLLEIVYLFILLHVYEIYRGCVILHSAIWTKAGADTESCEAGGGSPRAEPLGKAEGPTAGKGFYVVRGPPELARSPWPGNPRWVHVADIQVRFETGIGQNFHGYILSKHRLK